MEQFCAALNPDTELKAVGLSNNPGQCYYAKFPTLSELDAAYGPGAGALWLVPQLKSLGEMSGAKQKLTTRQYRTLATQIAARHKDIKVSELLLLFAAIKSGRYGKFYGAVDPMQIGQAIDSYIKSEDRLYSILRERTKRDLQRRDIEARQAITREQWEAIKSKNAK